MSTSRFIAITVTIALCFMAGCRPGVVTEENSASFNQVVVRADNSYELTMAQLYDHLNTTAFAPNGGIVGVDEISKYLDSLVTDSMAGFASNDIRLEDNYESYRLFAQRYNEFLINQFFQEAVYKTVETDSLEVVEYFESQPEMFTIDEHAFIYHILISAKGLQNGPDSLTYVDNTWDEIVKAAEVKAREVYETISDLETFKDAARKFSHDTASGVNGGLVGWVKPGVYLDPFDSVAFSMQPGEFTEPYEDSYGWHILYCEQHMEEGVPPMDEHVFAAAEMNLRTTKSNKIGRELLDSLWSDIDVGYNDDVMDANLFFVEEPVWVAVVNGVDTIDCGTARGAEINLRNTQGVANSTPEQKKQMLIQLVQRYSLLQAARDIGVDTLPEVVAERNMLYHKYAKIIFLRRYSDAGWLPTEEAIQQYYDQNAEDFQVEKPLVVQHIIVQDSLLGDFLREQAMSGIEFMDLAEEFYPGEDDVKLELADLGEIGPGDVPDAFWKAAMMTRLGEVSYPTKTEYGYHIIKVLEKRVSKTADLARPDIIEILKQQHRDELFRALRDEMYQRYNVQFPGKLNPVHLVPASLRG